MLLFFKVFIYLFIYSQGIKDVTILYIPDKNTFTKKINRYVKEYIYIYTVQAYTANCNSLFLLI